MSEEPRMYETPFDHPEIMDGYPMSKDEKAAVERTIRRRTPKVPRVLMPPWWHLQARYRHWRIQRYVSNELSKLSPEARAILDKMHDDELDRHLGT